MSHQRLNSPLADVMKIDGTGFEPEDPAALCQSLQSSGREPFQIHLNQKMKCKLCSPYIREKTFHKLNFCGLKQTHKNCKNLALYDI